MVVGSKAPRYETFVKNYFNLIKESRNILEVMTE